MSIRYDRGTIILKDIPSPPFSIFDPRVDCFRAPGFKYRELCEYFDNNEIEFSDDVISCDSKIEIITKKRFSLRPYQNDAAEEWLKHKKGIIILPTGAGKTILGMYLLHSLSIPTLIIVPTLALVEQWILKLREIFDNPIGEFSGNLKEIQSITVTTYDSATLNADLLGNRFQFLIFDEMHHLAGKVYQDIARKYIAPYRLGLTATLELEPNQIDFYSQIIGRVVFKIEPEDLTGKYLAPFELKKILVNFTSDEQALYDKFHQIFSQTLDQKGIRIHSVKDFTQLIIRSGKDQEIRQALAAHRKMERLTFNCAGKVDEMQKILQEGRKNQNRIIIFTKYNDMVHQISSKFLIPCITHNTAKRERQEILQKFRTGKYSAIIASQVLDEGIDIPAANLGIILSGTSSHRAFIQRLGRILRPQENKTAILYEIITRDTKETRVAATRKRKGEKLSDTD